MKKYETKRLQPPIFGRGIKVNQDFTENRRVFTREKSETQKTSSRKSRSRSRYTKSQSRTRSRSNDKRRSRGRRNSARRSISKQRSRSRERRYSSERRKYKDKDESRHYSSRRPRHSLSRARSLSPHEHEPECPLFAERRNREYQRYVSPLRPGEYRPGHPDLARRNRNNKERSRSPIKSDRYRRRSRSPYKSHSPTKRSRNSERRRSRSPHYGEKLHREYGNYEGWGPGPRVSVGRGGYPMRYFSAPPFHPRGIIPGPIIPPGHMIVPRMPMMGPYGMYRPHLPIYNSGAVRQRGPRPSIKSSTVTSEQEKDGDSEGSRVVITEASEQDGEINGDGGITETTDKNGYPTKEDEEGDK